jgi:hypothetical protein
MPPVAALYAHHRRLRPAIAASANIGTTPGDGIALVGTQRDSVPKKAVLDDSKKMRSNSTLVVKATSTEV